MRIGIGLRENPGGPRETLEDPGRPRCSPFAMLADKIKPPGTQDRCHGCHGCHRSGVKNCCSEPTCTRAGGQDDGSYTNSLKLVVGCLPSSRVLATLSGADQVVRR